MNVQRCPECGKRLNTNYCDICMKKVPFGGVKLANRRDPWENRDGSSAHRMEKDHECVSFEKTEKKSFPKPVQKQTTASNKRAAPLLGIILAVLSLIPAMFGLFEEAADSVAVPEPEYNIYEGFVLAGDPGAEGVPGVIAGEIYNANGIRITADDAGLSYGDYTVLMTIFNDTEQDISVSADLVSVNGYMLPYGMYQDVPAGESAQMDLTLYAHEMEKTSIVQVSDVTFSLDIYEEASFQQIAGGELVTVKTEYDGSSEPAVDISGMELYYDGSLCVLLSNVNLSGYGDCELDLYIENLSGSTVNVYSGDIWVNGEQVQGYYWKGLRPNTRAVDSAYIYELDNLDIKELAQINEITIDLYVDYMDGWDVVETISEKITFDPSAIY